MIILDGKIMQYNTFKSLEEIPMDQIESVTVLKPDQAEKLYGEKGKDGVVIINTKSK